jgi:hypothetical protein
MTAYEGDPATCSGGWSCALVELRSDFENEGQPGSAPVTYTGVSRTRDRHR